MEYKSKETISRKNRSKKNKNSSQNKEIPIIVLTSTPTASPISTPVVTPAPIPRVSQTNYFAFIFPMVKSLINDSHNLTKTYSLASQEAKKITELYHSFSSRRSSMSVDDRHRALINGYALCSSYFKIWWDYTHMLTDRIYDFGKMDRSDVDRVLSKVDNFYQSLILLDDSDKINYSLLFTLLNDHWAYSRIQMDKWENKIKWIEKYHYPNQNKTQDPRIEDWEKEFKQYLTEIQPSVHDGVFTRKRTIEDYRAMIGYNFPLFLAWGFKMIRILEKEFGLDPSTQL